MMYKQVLIELEQLNLQKIVWRSNPGNPLRTYEINRLVYGMTAASYLAFCCLHKLADIHGNSDPKISRIIKTDMYVDDLFTGADTPEEAKHICKRIDQILLTGGFELRKWRSNRRSVINDFSGKIESEPFEFSPEHIQQCKTLGLS
ncbi:hypothetical protein JTB14_013700 [Gonioctena quinquepunctata]|nr:hypothetical protein JTB14_013700 [Gonioctena quinquepunctata]